ncbi:MAG: 50S ribosome-binding GTPase [Firmicutes bacterium]|nr:50S ribosome-binding GTPase [Bacillota bacterium]MDD4264555.1 50S ribosome-binding GTPase [Bacillota bacterium]MDD4694398.1 50S ribosome-binding GTPase [Bacillota bacterium]
MKNCKGCGIDLQSKDPNLPGFIPEKVAARADVCQRCYRLTHYGDYTASPLSENEYLEAVSRAVEDAHTVFQVFDIIDFESSLNPTFEKILRKKNTVAVITKYDLLPVITTEDDVKEWAKKRIPYADDIVVVSGKRGWGLDNLGNMRGRVTAVVGTTNSGKSTLIQKLVADAKPTVSAALGTTLGNLTFKDEKGVIIDTPGLKPKGRLLEVLCPSCSAKLVPDKKINSKLYELKQDQGLALGNVFYFSLRSEKPIIAMAYVPEMIEIKRVNSDKADDFLNSLDTSESLLCEECRSHIQFTKRDLRIGDEDLVVPGLGWVSFRHTPASVEVICPSELSLPRRSPLVRRKKHISNNNRIR